MSKSKLNGINPIEQVELFGSDCLKMAIMFYGPNEKDIVWDGNLIRVMVNHTFVTLEPIFTKDFCFLSKLETRRSLKFTSRKDRQD